MLYFTRCPLFLWLQSLFFFSIVHLHMNSIGWTRTGQHHWKKKESTDLTQTKALQAKAQKYHASASSDSPPKRYVFPTVSIFEHDGIILQKPRFKDFYREHIQPTFSIQTADPERRAKATGKRNCTQDLSQSAKEVNKVRLNKLFSVFI